jgi:hypothetical protein
MKRRLPLISGAACCLLMLSPQAGLAAGFNWPTAGPYVNEIAHLLFLGAMIFFIYEIRGAALGKLRGFHYLLWAWALLALWNLDAFVGRWAEWTCTGPGVGGGSCYGQQLSLNGFYSWTALITQLMNFFLLVPAFYLFYRGIKALAQMPRAEHWHQ